MRRLLALGLGCLVSVTAYSEDLLTIFDQAVVNDRTSREADSTAKAPRADKPTGRIHAQAPPIAQAAGLAALPAADRRAMDQEQVRYRANLGSAAAHSH